MGNSRNLGLLFTESQCCFTTHLREDYIHYANPSHLSASNPSIKGARMVSLGSGLLGLPTGSKTPCVNDMQSSLREKEGRKEGHLHKTCKNAQKASSSSSSSRESTCRVRPTLRTAEEETFQLNTEALLPNLEHV